MSSNFDVIIFITARLFHYTLYCEHCPPTHHNQKPICSLHFHFHCSIVFCLFFYFERKSGLPRFSSKVCRTFRIVIIIKEASFFFLCVWACAVITRIPGHPLPPPPYFPPPTHSPSLINLMASVDVKHHVTYLPMRGRQQSRNPADHLCIRLASVTAQSGQKTTRSVVIPASACVATLR